MLGLGRLMKVDLYTVKLSYSLGSAGGCLIIPGSMHMFQPLRVPIMTSHNLCQLWLKCYVFVAEKVNHIYTALP